MKDAVTPSRIVTSNYFFHLQVVKDEKSLRFKTSLSALYTYKRIVSVTFASKYGKGRIRMCVPFYYESGFVAVYRLISRPLQWFIYIRLSNQYSTQLFSRLFRSVHHHQVSKVSRGDKKVLTDRGNTFISSHAIPVTAPLVKNTISRMPQL